MISVVMVQYNRHDLTRQAIESFRRHTEKDIEIILIDNASPDPEARGIAEELQGICFIQNGVNEGFSKANNRGSEVARGDVLLFLNNDTITTSDFVSPALDALSRNAEVGIVGPRLLNEDGTVQLSAGSLPSIAVEVKDRWLYRATDRNRSWARAYAAFHARRSHFVGWVSGAALFVRRSLFERINGFDESLFMYFEDKDLCCRAGSLGMKTLYRADTSVIHLRGASAEVSSPKTIEKLYRRSQIRYYRKHRPRYELWLLRQYQIRRGVYAGE